MVSLSGVAVEVDDSSVLTLLCGGALAAYILSRFERCYKCASSSLMYAIIVSLMMVEIWLHRPDLKECHSLGCPWTR